MKNKSLLYRCIKTYGLLFLAILGTAGMRLDGVKAQTVTQVEGDNIRLNWGSQQGVRVGLEAFLVTDEVISGKLQKDLRRAKIVIDSVSESESRGHITMKTPFTIKAGFRVVFLDKLTATGSIPTTTQRGVVTPPTTTQPPTVKTLLVHKEIARLRLSEKVQYLKELIQFKDWADAFQVCYALEREAPDATLFTAECAGVKRTMEERWKTEARDENDRKELEKVASELDFYRKTVDARRNTDLLKALEYQRLIARLTGSVDKEEIKKLEEMEGKRRDNCRQQMLALGPVFYPEQLKDWLGGCPEIRAELETKANAGLEDYNRMKSLLPAQFEEKDLAGIRARHPERSKELLAQAARNAEAKQKTAAEAQRQRDLCRQLIDALGPVYYPEQIAKIAAQCPQDRASLEQKAQGHLADYEKLKAVLPKNFEPKDLTDLLSRHPQRSKPLLEQAQENARRAVRPTTTTVRPAPATTQAVAKAPTTTLPVPSGLPNPETFLIMEKARSWSMAAGKVVFSDSTVSLTYEFVPIDPGEFTMGTDTGPKDQTPTHRVRISRRFQIGRTEVPQSLWVAIMQENPGRFKAAGRPIENVSYDDIEKFLKTLNSGKPDFVYRLPTEAEWEYVAGKVLPAGRLAAPADQVWHKLNSGDQTHEVGTSKPGMMGIYDLFGNVREWCSDKYKDNYYSKSPVDDPSGTTEYSQEYSIRGGSWNDKPEDCSPTKRFSSWPKGKEPFTGFRLVRTRK